LQIVGDAGLLEASKLNWPPMTRSTIPLFFVVAALFAALAAASPAAAMNFRTAAIGGACKARCPVVIVATGEIDDGTDREFVAFLQGLPNNQVRRLMFIHSPGGSLLGSMKFGLVLRAAKVATVVGQVIDRGDRSIPVSGACMSACVYAIMGGTQRYVQPSCKIGIHRASIAGSIGNSPLAVLLQQRRMPENVGILLRSYAKLMGVNPVIIDWAEKIGPGGIRILSPAEIAQLRLAKIG
jgi:hypothetical protein